MGTYKDWLAYNKGFELAVIIYNVTRTFPPEEKFSLTDQVRRCSRSVCANLAEAYKRRKYNAHFLSKLNDCETENAETEVWLDFAYEFQYITLDKHTTMIALNNEVGKLIHYMTNNPERFI
jgi:four helix bundle protein